VIERQQREDADVQRRLGELSDQLHQLEPGCEPHDRAIADAHTELETARQRQRQAAGELDHSGLFGRRAARHELAHATECVETAAAVLDELTDRAKPILTQRANLEHEYRHLRDNTRRDRWFQRALDNPDERIEAARDTITALNTWNKWASGHTAHPDRLIDAAVHLSDSDHGDHLALARPLLDWLEDRGVIRPQPSVEPTTPRIELPGLEIEI
jgi:hypothetical protein